MISYGSRLGVGSGGFEGVVEDGVGVYIVVGRVGGITFANVVGVMVVGRGHC